MPDHHLLGSVGGWLPGHAAPCCRGALGASIGTSTVRTVASVRMVFSSRRATRRPGSAAAGERRGRPVEVENGAFGGAGEVPAEHRIDAIAGDDAGIEVAL